MKNILTLCLIITLGGQGLMAQDTPDNEFDNNMAEIGDKFSSSLEPYLVQFAEKQFPDWEEKELRRLTVSNWVDIYRMKIKRATDELKFQLINSKNMGDKVDRQYIYKAYEYLYRFNFPGLDYKFFDQVKDDLF